MLLYKKNIKLLVLSLYTNYLPGENKKEKDVYILIYIEKHTKNIYIPIYRKNTIIVISIYIGKTKPIPGDKRKERDIHIYKGKYKDNYIYRNNTTNKDIEKVYISLIYIGIIHTIYIRLSNSCINIHKNG